MPLLFDVEMQVYILRLFYARNEARGFFLAKNTRHRSSPFTAPSVRITRGTSVRLFMLWTFTPKIHLRTKLNAKPLYFDIRL